MHAATTEVLQLRLATAADTDAIVDVWFAGWREAHLGHVPDALLTHRSPQSYASASPRCSQRRQSPLQTSGSSVLW